MTNLVRAPDLIKSFKQVAVDQSNDEKRKILVKEYLDEILLSLRPRLKRTKHKIIINCDEMLEIFTYPGFLSQIITNFIMNSLIHAFNDDEAGEIVIDFLLENDILKFIYIDNGKGIPVEHLGKIYEPFFTTKRNEGGTGLGLNIIYNIVTQKLGGTIECESEVGKYTKFTVKIPLNREA